MKNLLDKTKKDRLEKGFDLCLNNNKELIARNICSGSSCEVDRKAECEKGEILKGGYHTHIPGLSSRPSLHDLLIGLQYGMECIGTAKDNTIKCYVKKQFSSKEESIVMTRGLELINKFEDRNLIENEFDEFMRLEDTIKEKYFTIYDLK